VRVVAGLAKGRILKAVPGAATRPISDRVKVALFDILAPEISGASLLDLFSGTGAVGIEALSRGAARAVFVDRELVAIRVIHENLKITGLSAGAQVVRADAFSYLERRGVPAFDMIYIAPPQYRGMWREALQLDERGRPDQVEKRRGVRLSFHEAAAAWGAARKRGKRAARGEYDGVQPTDASAASRSERRQTSAKPGSARREPRSARDAPPAIAGKRIM